MFKISRDAYERMAERAAADYPEETCGFVFAAAEDLEVFPMENIQNELHAKDPKTYTRDAKTAYFMDPLALQRVLDGHDAAGKPLRAIYHSHPDHDAYFSESDSAAASPFGEPTYPEVVFPVFSVREGKVVDLKAFGWSDAERKYVEVAIAID